MAVPFYLTHPRLERLERTQMLEVEGGEHEWCMRILRHEAGHVIDNVFKLRLRRQRRALFGSSAEPYPEFYSPRPYSKSFVQHIDPWYAQSHPDEDFAETFAVWLTPESNWAQRYAGWAALHKLEYVDSLMRGFYAAASRSWISWRKSIRFAVCVTRCVGTIGASAAITASSTRSSTIANCGACSLMRPSSPAT
jgi:hypothetical protein